MAALNIPKGVKYTTFFIAVLLALLAMVGVGVTYAHKDTYYPGIKVGSVAVGGLSRDEAKKKVQDVVDKATARSVVVAMPDISQPKDAETEEYPEVEITTTAEELGFAVPVDSALDEAWKLGHGANATGWVKEAWSLFFGGGTSVAMNPTVDADKIKGFVATKVVAVASPPEPAKVVATGKNVVIEDQVPGLAVDDTELNRQLNAALVTSLDSDALSFRLPPRLSDAKITRTTVEPIATKWTALGDTKVSLTSSDVKLAPSREEILQWYIPVQSDKGEITLGLNAERIGTYLQKNGKTLDQKKSLAAVSKAAEDLLKTPKTSVEVAVVIKPTAEATAGEYKSGLFEGKYVYVNIKDQKLYRMNGQTMEKVYRISSGKWSTPTPRGTFKIAGKHPRAYSREYGLYMPYWQNFLGTSNDGEELPIGSYGLHELPEWPNGYKEGQGHLGTAVSHGCVRLGVGDAAEVYAWTETGTPVVIE